MKEEWVEYPELFFSSAKKWLEFEPLNFELKSSSACILDSGSSILLKIILDLSQNSDIIELIDRFIETISIEINCTSYRITNVEKIDINNGSSEVALSVIMPVPKLDIKFNPIQIGTDPSNIIYLDNPFKKKNWNLIVKLLYPSKPNLSQLGIILTKWHDSFIVLDGERLNSRIHPEHMVLRRYIRKKFRAGGWFCPIDSELMVGELTCRKCGWYPDKEMLVGFETIDRKWFSYYNKSSQGKHIFSVVQSMLESGNYVLSWNGLSYEFEVE